MSGPVFLFLFDETPVFSNPIVLLYDSQFETDLFQQLDSSKVFSNRSSPKMTMERPWARIYNRNIWDKNTATPLGMQLRTPSGKTS